MAEKRRKCSKCGTNRAERFYRSARGRVCLPCQKKRTSGATRAVRLEETYGITEDDYQRLLDAQGGVCAICGGKRTYNLDVDHSHALERAGVPTRDTVRGLLCKSDNRRLLRAAKDSPEILRAAANYLENPPAPSVLSGAPGVSGGSIEQTSPPTKEPRMDSTHTAARATPATSASGRRTTPRGTP